MMYNCVLGLSYTKLPTAAALVKLGRLLLLLVLSTQFLYFCTNSFNLNNHVYKEK